MDGYPKLRRWLRTRCLQGLPTTFSQLPTVGNDSTHDKDNDDDIWGVET